MVGFAKQTLLLTLTGLFILAGGGYFVHQKQTNSPNTTLNKEDSLLCIDYRPLPNIQTNLSSATYSYQQTRTGVTIAGTDGTSIDIEPLLVDTGIPADFLTYFKEPLFENAAIKGKIYSYHLDLPDTTTGYLLTNFGTLEIPAPEQSNDLYLILFLVKNNTPKAAASDALAQNIMRTLTFNSCSQKFNPATQGEGAELFRQLQIWIQSLPRNSQALITQANEVQKNEHQATALTKTELYTYERCSRFLIRAALEPLTPEHFKTLHETTPRSRGATTMGTMDLLYRNYTQVLRASELGGEPADLPHGYPTMISENMLRPSRAACQSLSISINTPETLTENLLTEEWGYYVNDEYGFFIPLPLGTRVETNPTDNALIHLISPVTDAATTRVYIEKTNATSLPRYNETQSSASEAERIRAKNIREKRGGIFYTTQLDQTRNSVGILIPAIFIKHVYPDNYLKEEVSVSIWIGNQAILILDPVEPDSIMLKRFEFAR